ncbi:MAG TPA: AraC family transcriptional regulator [Puia sp.]|nr:AraC family transcriptional regulator [Puia sp.]
MISRKLLPPEFFPANLTPRSEAPACLTSRFGATDCPTFRFADHTLLTQTIAAAYTCPPHIPGPGILTLLSGTGHFTLGPTTFLLDPSRYLLINHDTRLAIRLTCRSLGEGRPRPDTQPLFLFFRTDVVNEALTKQHADFCWLERSHPMNPELKERLDYLVSVAGSCSYFSNLRADAMIRDILLSLIRDALTAEATAKKLAVSRQSTRVVLYKRLSLAREWIHANYSTPASLDAMAEAAQLNRQHFLRMFRDCFGITPHQYVIDVRLAAARQLLSETKEPVTTICRMTGFESLSSFSGLFRRRFGASPKAYRQSQN